MKNGTKSSEIFGIRVASSQLPEVIERIKTEIEKRDYNMPFFMVTAYSETLLVAQENQEFKKMLEKADLIVADGVSLWMAKDYLNGKNFLKMYEDRPTGVKIFETFLRNRRYKKFLFGGFSGVAGRLAEVFGCYWSEEDPKIIEKINRCKPDILFVALGRVKQELWIADNLSKLKCKVIVGVGSAFDEVAGEGMWARPVPSWAEKMGLKWLWRARGDPKHWIRAFRAAVVFPWRVYRTYA